MEIYWLRNGESHELILMYYENKFIKLYWKIILQCISKMKKIDMAFKPVVKT